MFDVYLNGIVGASYADIADAEHHARRYAEMGFTHIKVKFGDVVLTTYGAPRFCVDPSCPKHGRALYRQPAAACIA